jgi:hypothetical protein
MGNVLGPTTNALSLDPIATVWSVTFVNKKTMVVAKARCGQILSLGLVFLAKAGRVSL